LKRRKEGMGAGERASAARRSKATRYGTKKITQEIRFVEEIPNQNTGYLTILKMFNFKCLEDINSEIMLIAILVDDTTNTQQVQSPS
jgi:hypothetical protein